MRKQKGRIFVSIGVSKPQGGLEELPGAITAAERMAAWATAQGYETLLLHDAAFPEITIKLLRNKITSLISEVTDEFGLKRLVIFFAGHGAALAIGDQYWILTHWQKRPTEAIRVSSLQRMLEYYGPKQVSVIGDACQEFSSKFIALQGSPVLDKPDEDQHPYELDQFFAVDVGKQAFMIKANGDKRDFCLFTEVLLNALEGDARESCFEEIAGEKVVTSQSLARYLDENVSREAGKYGVRMTPRPKPGFYTDRIYLTIPPSSGEVPFSSTFNLPVEKGSSGLSAFRPSTDELSQPAEPRRKAKPHPRSVGKAKLIKSAEPNGALDFRAESLEKAREASREALVAEIGSVHVRDHFETGCGICVSGAEVAEVEASFGTVSPVDEQPNWFRIRLQSGDADSLGWSDVLVTLADGRTVSVCVINGFVTAVHIIDAASVNLFHRPLGEPGYQGSDHAIDLLAQAHAGLLNRDAIINTAVMLRWEKHRIITLGCIAAQFYDAIRDVDSLRSMAAFYAIHDQPVPLDIILYGGGKISERGGRLYADIPAVAARQPRTHEEGMQRFPNEETPQFLGHPIAGRIPWMRQAWGAVATANCDVSGEVWRKQATLAMDYLAPGMFTVAPPDGRDSFYKLARIHANSGESEPFLTHS
ncbi:hypothetical protein [Variovorax sp. dw_954]|uniref:hypothetical protein n=1 Tax=Variovorax sp. dw_954 TaxID=2720078 RepID=UPI001BD1CAE7|nr:hypothetical protein [Variovorax sp. dw_954]